MHTLGLLLHLGVGGVQWADAEERAEESAAHAALAGNMCGAAVLGGCVRTGKGVRDEDVETGVALIKSAAAAGSPFGLCKLAALHETGEHPELVSANVYRAAELHRQAAEAPNALGLFNWGYAQMHGYGTVRDVHGAVRSWEGSVALAPADGSEEAAAHLGWHLRDWGELARSQEYLALASELGYVQDQ
mmetsp:Transcript_30205/g.98243  ORF Transcript_30205/g.98243 Transcript_30205/m.98243 type:complete len:189 (+) Transcript_30205:199-765(+)